MLIRFDAAYVTTATTRHHAATAFDELPPIFSIRQIVFAADFIFHYELRH